MGSVEIPTEKYNQMVETQNKIITTVKEIYPGDWKDVSLLQDVRNVDLIKGELRQLIRAYKSPLFTKIEHDNHCRAQFEHLIDESEVKRIIDPTGYKKDNLAYKQILTCKRNKVLKGWNFWSLRRILNMI